MDFVLTVAGPALFLLVWGGHFWFSLPTASGRTSLGYAILITSAILCGLVVATFSAQEMVYVWFLIWWYASCWLAALAVWFIWMVKDAKEESEEL